MAEAEALIVVSSNMLTAITLKVTLILRTYLQQKRLTYDYTESFRITTSRYYPEWFRLQFAAGLAVDGGFGDFAPAAFFAAGRDPAEAVPDLLTRIGHRVTHDMRGRGVEGDHRVIGVGGGRRTADLAPDLGAEHAGRFAAFVGRRRVAKVDSMSQDAVIDERERADTGAGAGVFALASCSFASASELFADPKRLSRPFWFGVA